MLPYSWVGRLNMATLLKLKYRFSVIPIKIPDDSSAEINKLILKIMQWIHDS